MYFIPPNQYIEYGKPFVLNDNQYGSDWLNIATQEQKDALGLQEVITVGTREDEKYFYVSEELVGNERRIINTPKSEEQLAQMERSKLEAESKQYLIDTDWYVIRMMETGKQIPTEVQEKRIAARLAINTTKDY